MELRHLRYFVGLAGELHFGRAAERLGISQPPLSQQIRQLEAELGVPLFERSSRRVRLTEAGRLFLDQARATLAQADQAISTARRAAEGEIGALAIGFSGSSLFVPAAAGTIAAYRRRYADVHLDLGEMTLVAQRDAFARGMLDIGLTRAARRPILPPGLDARAIEHDGLLVAMPADHPLAATSDPIPLAALADEPMVQYPSDREGFMDDLWRLFAAAGLHPNIVQEAQEISTLLALVAAGLGITIVPETLRRLSIATLRYRPIADPGTGSTVWLLHPAEPLPVARRFLALLVEGMGG